MHAKRLSLFSETILLLLDNSFSKNSVERLVYKKVWISKKRKSMALAKRLIRGELGKGVNVYEDQLNLLTSDGSVLDGASGAWHLELSPTKHVYLTRRGPDLRLMFKEFTKETGSLRPSSHWVEMDLQQTTDFIFMSPDIIFTCRRNDITAVSTKEIYHIYFQFLQHVHVWFKSFF